MEYKVRQFFPPNTLCTFIRDCVPHEDRLRCNKKSALSLFTILRLVHESTAIFPAKHSVSPHKKCVSGIVKQAFRPKRTFYEKNFRFYLAGKKNCSTFATAFRKGGDLLRRAEKIFENFCLKILRIEKSVLSLQSLSENNGER